MYFLSIFISLLQLFVMSQAFSTAPVIFYHMLVINSNTNLLLCLESSLKSLITPTHKTTSAYLLRNTLYTLASTHLSSHLFGDVFNRGNFSLVFFPPYITEVHLHCTATPSRRTFHIFESFVWLPINQIHSIKLLRERFSPWHVAFFVFTTYKLSQK